MNKNVVILLFSASLMAFSSPASGLALWKFDKLDVNGHILDESGRSNLQPIGEVELQPGLNGNAALLVQGRPFFRAEHNDRLSLTDDFTIRAVFLPHNVRGFNVILWKGDRGKKPEEVNYYLGIRDQKVEFKYKDDEDNWYVHTANYLLESNHWYDVSVHFKEGKVDIAINGDLALVQKSEGRAASAPTKLYPSTGFFEVGEAEGPSSYKAYARGFPFSGLIDEISITQGRSIRTGGGVKTRHKNQAAAYQKKVEEREVAVLERRKEEYRRLFEKENQEFMVKILPVSERINKGGDLVDKLLPLKEAITLYAARNEYESTQVLLLANPKAAVTDVKITIHDLTNEAGASLSSEHASWGWIRSVKIAPEVSEAIPDIIVEGVEKFNVNAGDFTPVLIRWYVPLETKPGVYRGSVHVESEGLQTRIPVELTVWDFDLPRKNSIPVAFTFFESYYSQWYGADTLTRDQKLNIYEFMLRFRIPPNNIYARDLYPEYSLLKEIKDRTSFVTVGSWSLNDSKPGVKEKRIEKFHQTMQKLKELGLEESAYFFGTDELEQDMEKRFPVAENAYQALHEEFPNLKTMQTSFPRPEYEAFYNVWVPSMRYFVREESLQKFDSLREKGDEIWWYLTSRPQHPFPQFFIDYPPFSSRIMMTLTHMYDVKGILYWAMNREWLTNLDIREQWMKSEEAEWKPYIYHIHTGTQFNVYGIGNLIYPGRDGELLPSLRLENFRDGIEDYEYLALLNRLVNEQENGALAEEARALLQVPPEVAKAVNDFNPDPAALLNYRKEVARMIERLQGARNE